MKNEIFLKFSFFFIFLINFIVFLLKRIDTLRNKIRSIEDEIAVSVIKVKELEGLNKILEKEEFLAKDPAEFQKNVKIRKILVFSLKN